MGIGRRAFLRLTGLALAGTIVQNQIAHKEFEEFKKSIKLLWI